jgi:hypothetical protein
MLIVAIVMRRIFADAWNEQSEVALETVEYTNIQHVSLSCGVLILEQQYPLQAIEIPIESIEAYNIRFENEDREPLRSMTQILTDQIGEEAYDY